MYLQYYLKKLGYPNIPNFLIKYLNCPSLLRLKQVGYFCGMDYASKDIYNFSEHITRFDHSLTTALLVYKITKDEKSTIAALFHDIATPCFSHVIDYMNKDYEHQETTEEFTKKVIMGDNFLQCCLEKDHINPEDIINFKQYTIVDNERPKLCADRLDGIILTGIGWTKDITTEDIDSILENIMIINNEYNEQEIGFKNLDVAKRVLEISDNIDTYCHSAEDNYMMLLLAKITKIAIKKGYIGYEDLYYINEDIFFKILNTREDEELNSYLNLFRNIKKENIPNIEIPNVKKRILSPVVIGNRIG